MRSSQGLKTRDNEGAANIKSSNKLPSPMPLPLPSPSPSPLSWPADKAAGKFAPWLRQTINIIHNRSEATVPCAECSACCNSAYFVHIRPSDTQALAHIPKALTFAAPGLPKGHRLLGYDENGRCPMYVDGGCSIYEFRPQTCRQYDCRVFAATGIGVEAQNDGAPRTRIKQQAERWSFEFSSDDDSEAFSAVQLAAKFLNAHADAFPLGFLPASNTQRAILAIESYALFLAPKHRSTNNLTTEQTVQAIVEMREQRQV